MTDIATVVPVYNEVYTLERFHQRLVGVLDTLGMGWTVLYVNDGSADGSSEILAGIAGGDSRVSVIELSRNFGKEAAITAGLDLVDSDAVVVMDADLQHPPLLIVDFLELWRDGADVVYARRRHRDQEGTVKRAGARMFYRILLHGSEIDIPENVADFRLMSRRAVNAVRALRENHRFMKGLFAWIGFEQRSVEYECEARQGGQSKCGVGRLMDLALEGITSFSIEPLRLSSIVGATIVVLAILCGIWVIIKTMLFGDPMLGFPSLMATILFLGGLQLLALGIIGEYIGRTFGESKRRPIYIIKDIQNRSNVAPATPFDMANHRQGVD